MAYSEFKYDVVFSHGSFLLFNFAGLELSISTGILLIIKYTKEEGGSPEAARSSDML